MVGRNSRIANRSLENRAFGKREVRNEVQSNVVIDKPFVRNGRPKEWARK